MLKKIEESAKYIADLISEKPDFAVVLGSGFKSLLKEVKILKQIDFVDIPHFENPTVLGHKGNLTFGILGERKVLIMEGRLHYYEGYDMKTVVLPIRVFKAMGIENLFLTNASGGINPSYRVGDLVLINDHISLLPESPLRGAHIPSFGERFVNMYEAYDAIFIKQIQEIAKAENIPLNSGIYMGVTGPTYETQAEYRFMHKLGADCVGMSTVPEVIAARQMKMRCIALSVIADTANDDHSNALTHDLVLKAMEQAIPKATKLIRCFLEQILVSNTIEDQ